MIAATGPPTDIPWWMGVAIVCAWMALLLGIVFIARGRRRLARARRPTVLPRASAGDTADPAGQRGLPEETGGVRELGPG